MLTRSSDQRGENGLHLVAEFYHVKLVATKTLSAWHKGSGRQGNDPLKGQGRGLAPQKHDYDLKIIHIPLK